MSVKIALLKSGESIISDIKELISDEKVCGYLFTKPHTIITGSGKSVLLVEEPMDDDTMSVVLSPWILFTSDDEIPIRPDWIVSIVEPVKDIKQMYEEKVNGTNSQVSSSEE